MSLVDQLLGRSVREDATADVVPVPAGKQRLPARREPPKDKEEEKLKANARRSSVVAHIMGMSESDEEAIIPDSAESLDPLSPHQIPGLSSNSPALGSDGPSEPSVTNIHGEELIPPNAALVAPDVTPNVMIPIDPSQVPSPPRAMERPTPPTPMAAPPTQAAPAPPPTGSPNQGVIDTILGRQNAAPQPEAAAAQAMAERMMSEAINGTVEDRVAAKLVPAVAGGEGMPVHQESDGRATLNVFRRFNG